MFVPITGPNDTIFATVDAVLDVDFKLSGLATGTFGISVFTMAMDFPYTREFPTFCHLIPAGIFGSIPSLSAAPMTVFFCFSVNRCGHLWIACLVISSASAIAVVVVNIYLACDFVIREL